MLTLASTVQSLFVLLPRGPASQCLHLSWRAVSHSGQLQVATRSPFHRRHPGPVNANGTFVGRGAAEIGQCLHRSCIRTLLTWLPCPDIFEAYASPPTCRGHPLTLSHRTVGATGGEISQSGQWVRSAALIEGLTHAGIVRLRSTQSTLVRRQSARREDIY